MINVCVVEVEGADYEGRCFVLVAADEDAAVRALKKKYARFKTQVRWHELQRIDENGAAIEADFDYVPAYFNEHTARYYISAQTVNA